jgi:hypothetical protein
MLKSEDHTTPTSPPIGICFAKYEALDRRQSGPLRQATQSPHFIASTIPRLR